MIDASLTSRDQMLSLAAVVAATTYSDEVQAIHNYLDLWLF